MSAPKSPTAPLSDDEIDALADLVDLIDERTDVPISLEGLDGFITALVCSPRAIPPEEYFPVLLDREDGLATIFEDESDEARFLALLDRRRKEIARALAAPIENLADPKALSPLVMDWNGLLAELPPAEAKRLEAAGIPPYAQLWAGGFLLAVEHWEDDWTLPAGSKDEAFVDEVLDPFYVLAAPLDELTPDERAVRRGDHLALALWGAYELREFWLDRGQAPRH
ncbi:MAG: YecA family protein [Thiobacillus sp.]|nr:YecA family protein [Thiobacillus sp.]MDP2057269.1 YecA family protein [Thiobacillus sp.]